MSSCSTLDSNIAEEPNPGAIDDEMLVEAARSGEEWAFVELCTRNSKVVFNTIYGVTKNRQDAEDALQDSTMRALLHLKQFDGRSSFATWFTRIGINSALMILRKRRSRIEISIDATAEGETWQTWQIADHSRIPRSIMRCARGPCTCNAPSAACRMRFDPLLKEHIWRGIPLNKLPTI